MTSEDDLRKLIREMSQHRYKKMKEGHKATCAAANFIEGICDCGCDKEYAESILGQP